MADPFLKWAGGKRQLLPQLLSHVPAHYRTYHEPFIGGGALFFHLAPTKAHISDANLRLIRTYRGVRDHVEEVIELLGKMQGRDRAYFDHVRDQAVDTYISDATVAAWLIYLNKAGFNGIYRVNQAGKFNVPFGKDESAIVCDPKRLRECSMVLQAPAVTITHQDFYKAAERVEEGDFVYFDPPYVPLSETSSFAAYTADGFGPEDQECLRDVAFDLQRRGAYVLISNSDCPEVRTLYAGAEIVEVEASRAVNSKASGRGKVGELLIVLDPKSQTR
jgi:DNA adenine methylase